MPKVAGSWKCCVTEAIDELNDGSKDCRYFVSLISLWPTFVRTRSTSESKFDLFSIAGMLVRLTEERFDMPNDALVALSFWATGWSIG